MRRIYIAGAYSADNVPDVQANMRRGLRLSVEVLKAGFAPFCPWLDFQFGLIASVTINEYYAYSMAWLEAADAVLIVPEKIETSKGAQAELQRAVELKIPIYRSLKDLKYGFRDDT